MVGATGAVLGIDRSAPSIDMARQRALALGIQNVQFEMAELDSLDTARKFDAAIGRLVLVHLRDPLVVLRRIRNFLTPNGVIAFQEMDLQLEMQVPASQLYTRVRSWLINGLSAGGDEPYMGSKLLSMFMGAGLPRPTMIMGGRVESGQDSNSYDLLASVVRSLLPLLERYGIATAEEVAIDTLADRLRQEAVVNECVTFFPSLVGAWVRVP
jgi:ubiquinone/menaquinone biosynthesis C-methylase UbiE